MSHTNSKKLYAIAKYQRHIVSVVRPSIECVFIFLVAVISSFFHTWSRAFKCDRFVCWVKIACAKSLTLLLSTSLFLPSYFIFSWIFHSSDCLNGQHAGEFARLITMNTNFTTFLMVITHLYKAKSCLNVHNEINKSIVLNVAAPRWESSVLFSCFFHCWFLLHAKNIHALIHSLTLCSRFCFSRLFVCVMRTNTFFYYFIT